ncbi:tetraacyldisaccharide 4'-kinase [Flavobacterium taihuense]|uniref:Tetraacyldisaccharide 4'-kinase n=1 Tax=Flavobacterium taihuense TaxID=2857508 RepID=A0ABS6XZW4_9FLAO|nr:tetraacyldisaccharide 4'-kinase [Flavobacterium taihuense]MBW4362205.1 tetraacyldisaccharide 4'-kinase [Flavobacterium taihuense]
MNLLRKILFPFAILYGFITSIRNFLFDKGILKTYSFDIPVIAVGNLSVGGTGKTPQIEYLIRLLSDKYKVATLSRGYKRQSEGFVLANSNSDALQLGDEPFQFYQKFKDIQVAVDANRKNGIEQLLSNSNPPEVILLDDAFQHRKVKAGFYIMLTSYGDLYCNDFILPTGNLRESRSGVQRANIVIVTKCPSNLSLNEQNAIKKQLNLSVNQSLFFTFIDYDDVVYSDKKMLKVSEIKNMDKLLLAGIAKPESFFAYLKQENDECLTFPDHHHFSEGELEEIKKKANSKIIVTTEKDYVRLKGSILSDQLYYLPIKSTFLSDGDNFDKNILNYVGQSTRDR